MTGPARAIGKGESRSVEGEDGLDSAVDLRRSDVGVLNSSDTSYSDASSTDTFATIMTLIVRSVSPDEMSMWSAPDSDSKRCPA